MAVQMDFFCVSLVQQKSTELPRQSSPLLLDLLIPSRVWLLLTSQCSAWKQDPAYILQGHSGVRLLPFSLSLFLFVMFQFFLRQDSQCSRGTGSVKQSDLQLTEILLPMPPQLLRLKVCTTPSFFLKIRCTWFYFMCVDVLALCMSVHNMHAIREEARSCYVGSGNRIWVFWKSRKCF